MNSNRLRFLTASARGLSLFSHMQLFFLFLVMGLMLAAAGRVHAAGEDLDEKALPLVVIEKLMVSPEAARPLPGDIIKTVALDDTRTMKLVVHMPAAPQKIIQVALPAAGTDAGPVLAKAIADARATGVPTKIVLAPGVYTIVKPVANKNWGIDNVTDLTVEGSGATLVFKNSGHGILFNNVRRVLLNDIKLKYEGLKMASFGQVVSQNGQFYLKLDTEFAANEGAPVLALNQVKAGTNFNNKKDVWLNRSFNEFYNPTATWDPALKMYLLSKAMFATNPSNERYLVRHTVYGATAIRTGAGMLSEDISLNKITIYNSPGMGVVGTDIKRGLSMTNSRMLPDPADPMALMSVASDGFHTENVGGDIILENNDFSMMGDDVMNFTNRVKGVTSVKVDSATDATLSLIFDSRFILQGNVIAVYGKGAEFLGLAVAKANALSTGTKVSNTMTSTYASDEGVYTLPVTNNLTGTGFASKFAVADFKGAQYVRNVSLLGARYYVGNNTFHDHRGRGILAKVPVGVIEKNTLSGNTWGGIILSEEVHSWMEGSGVALVRVSDNKLSNMAGYAYLPLTMVAVMSDGGTVQNVLIENNKFLSDSRSGSAICADINHALRVTFKDNTCDQDIIVAASTNRVTVTGNQMKANATVRANKQARNFNGQ